MSIINAVASGAIGDVPAGFMRVDIVCEPEQTGNTVSGLTFTLSSGSSTYSATTGSDGRVSVDVAASGTYTVTPPTLGIRYIALATKTIAAESTVERTLTYPIDKADLITINISVITSSGNVNRTITVTDYLGFAQTATTADGTCSFYVHHEGTISISMAAEGWYGPASTTVADATFGSEYNVAM